MAIQRGNTHLLSRLDHVHRAGGVITKVQNLMMALNIHHGIMSLTRMSRTHSHALLCRRCGSRRSR